jgi:type II secretory pathway pseudopilin PulG
MLLGIFALIISLLAVGVAALARRDSKRAADAAERAADAAEASAREAKRANDLSETIRAEQLAERDRQAVTWQLGLMNAKRYLLTNTGSVRAIDVRVAGDGIIPGNMKDVIDPGEHVDFHYDPAYGSELGGTVTYRRDGSTEEFVYTLPL